MKIKGIGVDVVEVSRIKKLIEKNNKFIEKIFNQKEISYCEERRDKEVHYAARFAAKEAFFKAAGSKWREGIKWKNISVENDESGKPEIVLKGETLEFFEKIGYTRIHLSISHSAGIAVSFVIIE